MGEIGGNRLKRFFPSAAFDSACAAIATCSVSSESSFLCFFVHHRCAVSAKTSAIKETIKKNLLRHPVERAACLENFICGHREKFPQESGNRGALPLMLCHLTSRLDQQNRALTHLGSPPSPHEPGPAQGFLLLKGCLSCHCCLLMGQALGFCKAPGDRLEHNGRCINKVIN